MKYFLVLLISACCFTGFAQTRSEAIVKINDLVKKAAGKKVSSLFGEDKITRQSFTEKEVMSAKKGTKKGDDEWFYVYKNVPWDKIKSAMVLRETDDVVKIEIKFKNRVELQQVTEDDLNKPGNTRTTPSIDLYALSKDEDEIDRLFKLIIALRPAPAEPASNAVIKRLSKTETIAWLKENLLKSFGGMYIDEIRLKSFDECNIVLTYEDLTDSYEEVMPTTIKGIDDDGFIDYEGAAVKKTSLKTSSKTGMKKFSTLRFYDADDEEKTQNIIFAFKHLATFCKI